eukprot:c6343_g1_i1 orf=250-801(+)
MEGRKHSRKANCPGNRCRLSVLWVFCLVTPGLVGIVLYSVHISSIVKPHENGRVENSHLLNTEGGQNQNFSLLHSTRKGEYNYQANWEPSLTMQEEDFILRKAGSSKDRWPSKSGKVNPIKGSYEEEFQSSLYLPKSPEGSNAVDILALLQAQENGRSNDSQRDGRSGSDIKAATSSTVEQPY